jgi:hypothetical protein
MAVAILTTVFVETLVRLGNSNVGFGSKADMCSAQANVGWRHKVSAAFGNWVEKWEELIQINHY